MPGWSRVHAWIRGAAVVLVFSAVVVGAPLSLAAASATAASPSAVPPAALRSPATAALPTASQTGPSSMPGMADGSMPGMTDGSMPGMADMPGMDHAPAAASGTPTAHPRALVLGGFALVNLVVLLAAAILRRRTRRMSFSTNATCADLVRNVP